MSIGLTPSKPPKSSILRLLRCMFRQGARTRICPPGPRLDGKTVLITGGSAGVGEYVSRGLIARGAKVVSLSRGISQGKGGIADLRQVKCDLSCLQSVADAVGKVGDQKIDILICNSGVLLHDHEMASDEVEMTFAVNVLGHHLLYRLLIEQGKFAEDARIVMTSGDAYVMAQTCDVNPLNYSSNRVYGGSKLGNLWQMRELAIRYPALKSYAIHPGVILSGFGGFAEQGGLRSWLAKRLLISEELGAQAALIAATQDVPSGTYWHNVWGVMDLPEDDAGMDRQKSGALWDQLELLSAAYL
ncbi:NAD(P)-dependent dehydrogenase, short-chain alcohol dehydrogenase family [Pseudovibrio ascidiaceicola]|uniref:NAD(P)-dependent dehydrogenase, short-chain alcohol dehydrogenase family n=2 Tax=Pseudovibrio ascidiaceicola TaxID=285279 RepID=A0A1I4D3P2_9HYPH|nr:NAD(P)-dependent dehydrogenase, short-chain alcohol dehydrogenase family [Pseudovibrio ascidiaceicola]